MAKKKNSNGSRTGGDTAEFVITGGKISVGGRGETKKIFDIVETEGEGKKLVGEDGEEVILTQKPTHTFSHESPQEEYSEPEWVSFEDDVKIFPDKPKSDEKKPSDKAKSDEKKPSGKPKSEPQKSSDKPKPESSKTSDKAKSEPKKTSDKPKSEPKKTSDKPKSESKKSSDKPKSEPKKASGKSKAESKPSGKPSKLPSMRAIVRVSLRVFIVLAVVLTIVGIFGNSAHWNLIDFSQCGGGAHGSKGFPVTLSGGRSMGIEAMSGGVAALTDTSFSLYNASSKQVFTRTHFMSSPAMKVSGRYALLMDIGNKSYRLEGLSKTICTGETDDMIISGDVAPGGRFAIVTQGLSLYSSRPSSIEVFDRKGGSICKWQTADYYITDVALSSNGKYLAMCGVNASEGKLSSAVIIHKVGYKDIVAEIECVDNIFLSVGYTASGALMAIGESEALVISDNGANVNKIAYGGELVAFDINFDYGTALYVSGVDDEGSVMLYDTRGDRRFSVPAPEYCVALSVTDNGCALLCRGELHLYRNNGTVANTFETSAVSSDVLTFGGASYVLDGVKLNKYR